MARVLVENLVHTVLLLAFIAAISGSDYMGDDNTWGNTGGREKGNPVC